MAQNIAELLLRNIQALLAARGLSQNEFARRTGIPQTTISGLIRALENGRTVRLGTLEAVAQGFKVSVAQLIAPDLKVDSVGEVTPSRVLSRQVGRLTEDFLLTDDRGRQEILATAKAQVTRSLKATK